MILPWAHRLISAGAHGLRRIPGQSVNLAHLIWRNPCAPAPLLLKEAKKVHPRWFSARGYGCSRAILGEESSPLPPAAPHKKAA